ncbi:MAG TPA: peptidoglycan DD-metalloendopeptidase family protein [Vitreimonas sp.]|nr:peptidoglycan DD-metalloendopeptidase family protein [Vitreimonas sp.]
MKARKGLASSAVLSAGAVIGLILAWHAGLFNASAASAADRAAVRDEVARRAEQNAFTEPYLNQYARELHVGDRETFAALLSRAGVSPQDSGAALSALSKVYNPARVQPNQVINVYFSRDGANPRLTGLAFRSEPGASVTADRTDTGFTARELQMPLSFEIARISAPVENGLYATALKRGATEHEINSLADAFAYDVDFQRDVRPGDHFELVFERFYDDQGHTVRTGDMLFISLETRNGSRAFYQFLAPGDSQPTWYDADGNSAQRFLMKTPVNGARLSSAFGVRIHPVLGYSMMHRGVDFAAAIGTPILAAGDGTVERAGPFSTYGNYVKLRHANGYETAYAHMSRVAVRAGARVRQGQIIGYVGETGRATGPHLHYEVLRGGQQVNPMSLRVPNGRNLTGRALELFMIERERIDTIRLQRDREAPGAAESAVTQVSDTHPARVP